MEASASAAPLNSSTRPLTSCTMAQWAGTANGARPHQNYNEHPDSGYASALPEDSNSSLSRAPPTPGRSVDGSNSDNWLVSPRWPTNSLFPFSVSFDPGYLEYVEDMDSDEDMDLISSPPHLPLPSPALSTHPHEGDHEMLDSDYAVTVYGRSSEPPAPSLSNDHIGRPSLESMATAALQGLKEDVVTTASFPAASSSALLAAASHSWSASETGADEHSKDPKVDPMEENLPGTPGNPILIEEDAMNEVLIGTEENPIIVDDGMKMSEAVGDVDEDTDMKNAKALASAVGLESAIRDEMDIEAAAGEAAALELDIVVEYLGLHEPADWVMMDRPGLREWMRE